MLKAKSRKPTWPPIVRLTYPSGKSAWQVACMIQGQWPNPTV